MPEQTGIGPGVRNHFLVLFFLAVATFLAYSSSLRGTWALDDTTIGQFGNIRNMLDLRLGYREVAYLSFLLNRWIDPLDPVNYRVLNILIHVCNSVLVYTLAYATLRLPALRERYAAYSFPVALVSGVVFALHPLNINAVAYIVQRMTSLAVMFVLLALLSYMAGRTVRVRLRASACYALSLVFIFLGIFSKENAVMAVPLILLYDYFFISGPGTKKFPAKSMAVLSAGLLLLASASFFLGFHDAVFQLLGEMLHPTRPISPAGWTATDVYWTPVQHVLTEFRVVGRYLMIFFLPLPGFQVFDWWGFPVSGGLLDPVSTSVWMLVLAALLVFSIYGRKRLPFLSFGILWYFIALSLESFIAVGADLYFEHRNYLPLTGLLVGVSAQVFTSFDRSRLKTGTVWIIALAFALPLGVLTFERNQVWKDSRTLWEDTVGKTPGNLRALVALGNASLRESDLRSAADSFEKALSLSESEQRPHFFRSSGYSLGMTYLFMRDLKSAKRVIEMMDADIEGTYVTGILKGYYLFLDGDTKGAIASYEKVLPVAVFEDKIRLYTLLGDAYRKNGQAKEALEVYKKALDLDPSFSSAYYGIGSTFLSMGRPDDAYAYMEKTLSIDPNHALALSDMADIAIIRKEPLDRAMAYARRAVAKDPPFYQPFAAMANVLIVSGEEEAADGYFKKAVQRGLEDYMVPFIKARAFYMKGDKARAEMYLREVAAMHDLPENLRKTVDASLGNM